MHMSRNHQNLPLLQAALRAAPNGNVFWRVASLQFGSSNTNAFPYSLRPLFLFCQRHSLLSSTLVLAFQYTHYWELPVIPFWCGHLHSSISLTPAHRLTLTTETIASIWTAKGTAQKYIHENEWEAKDKSKLTVVITWISQLIYDTAILTFTRPRVFPTFKHYKILSPNNT